MYLCTNLNPPLHPPHSMLHFVCFILLYFRSTFYLTAFLVLLIFLHFLVFLKMGASSTLNAKKNPIISDSNVYMYPKSKSSLERKC